MRQKLLLSAVIVVVTLAASGSLVFAQNYLNATGNPSFGVNVPIENGFINIANGNVHLEIPLAFASPPQRGNLKLSERLVYDSRIWQIVNNGSNYSWQPTDVPNSMAGWRFVNGMGSEPAATVALVNPCTDLDNDQEYPQGETSYTWTDATGTMHSFDGFWVFQDADCSPSQPQTQSFAATDASGYLIAMSGYSDEWVPDTVTIYDSNGNAVYSDNAFLPPVFDRYGNSWSLDGNGNLIDDVGNTPVTMSTSGNQITYTVLSFGGGHVQYVVTTESIPLATNFGQSGVREFSGSITGIQSIELPDGSSYTFQYDPNSYGELISMTLPTGGTVDFGYTNYLDSYQNQNRWLNGYDGGHGGLSFYPSVVTNCSGPTETGCVEQVKESTATGDDTVYTLTLNNGAWNTEEDAYQGPVSGGHQLVSVVSGYDLSIGCIPGVCTGAEDVTKQEVATTLSDVGLTTETTYGYTAPQTGLPASMGQWDYFTASPSGSPTLNSQYTYNGTNDLTEAQTFDSGNNLVAQTNYNYTATATPTSGIVGHGTPNPSGYAAYLGSVVQWAGGSNTLTTSFTNDDTGSELTSTDPNGQTTFGRDSTDTYVTGVTPPTPSSGVSLSQSATYDPSTGLLTSTTDPNGAVTSYSLYDWDGRPAQINYPDGGSETFANYSPADRGDSRTMNGTTSTQTRTLLDGYGRLSRVAVFNGQSSNPWYQNDYCYDADGRLQFASYRYQGNGWASGIVCSGAGDTYSYDALGRFTQVLHGDGTSVNYQYRGRATEVTDENGVSRISQVDGLGRVIAVCEISSNGSMPGSGSPASCGLDISGTGFLSTYAYNLANHQTTVTEGVQTRIFQTDALGRTISVQEPESGTTTYSYAYNGTGLVTTRIRPQANQTNPSVTTTTTTQYDAVGRVVGVNYSDGITPNKTFVYDTAQGGFGWDQAPNATNLKGRLAVMGAETSAANLTGALFSYDAMGRVVGMWQCGPSICGTASQGTRYLGFSYDQTGNLSSYSDPVSGTIVYYRSPAGEVTSITNQSYTIGNVYNPGVDNPLVPSVQNGPFGPNSYNLANGVGVAVTYDPLGRLNGTYACLGSPQVTCSGETEQYGFWVSRQGDHVNEACYGPCAILGYDEFGRLTSSNLNAGEQSFSYVYDRYGNRWAQNVASGSGPSWSASYNSQTNQIVGYGYDAAGNVTNDGSHAYQYDAEGNLLTVDGGNTASYIYDAMNRRVGVANTVGDNEFSYDYAGRRISTWPVATNSAVEGRIYWDGQQIAYHSYHGLTYFEHQDWLGTERVRTDPWGAVQAEYSSLAFGDGSTQTVEGTMVDVDQDNNSFTSLELDPETETDHAQFRQYSPGAGSWMSPDPYGGSYDIDNPQSFNRYSYVLNNPLTFTDPSGQDGGGIACVAGPIACIGGLVAGGIIDWILAEDIFSGGPSFHGSLKARPGASDPGSFGESLGIPTSIPQGNWGISLALNLPTEGCEFGACGSGGMDLTNGQGDSSSSTTYSTDYFPPGVLRLPSIHDKPNVSRNSGYCSAYRDGRGIGNGLAFLCGKVFPDGPWSNCVRGKLLQQYVPGDNVAIWGYLFYDHPKDFVTCKVY